MPHQYHEHWPLVVVRLPSCPTLCNPMERSMPAFPVFQYLPELVQIHVHWVGDAIQLSHSVPPPSPPALNLSQHQGLFQWVGSLYQVARVLEPQLQHQSFQWSYWSQNLTPVLLPLDSDHHDYFPVRKSCRQMDLTGNATALSHLVDIFAWMIRNKKGLFKMWIRDSQRPHRQEGTWDQLG